MKKRIGRGSVVRFLTIPKEYKQYENKWKVINSFEFLNLHRIYIIQNMSDNNIVAKDVNGFELESYNKSNNGLVA